MAIDLLNLFLCLYLAWEGVQAIIEVDAITPWPQRWGAACATAGAAALGFAPFVWGTIEPALALFLFGVVLQRIKIKRRRKAKSPAG